MRAGPQGTSPCAGLDPARIDALPDPGPREAGTLFLDGVEDLDPPAQARLLARLSACEGLRVIAATRTDLAALTRSGGFRADLYFRLAGAVLKVPPLRLRQDFDWLLDRLLRRLSADSPRLTPAARAELKARAWPGNIRELASTLEVALALSECAVIDLPDLPPPALAEEPDPAPEEDLEALLDACSWNMARAARRLGVNRSTVLRRVRALGLTPPQ